MGLASSRTEVGEVLGCLLPLFLPGPRLFSGVPEGAGDGQQLHDTPVTTASHMTKLSICGLGKGQDLLILCLPQQV